MRLFELDEKTMHTILILSGLHGDEKTSVEIANTFLPLKSKNIVVLPCINPQGYKDDIRDHKGEDLNRSFSHYKKEQVTPEIVKSIKKLLPSVSLVIDLHSTPIELLPEPCCLVNNDSEEYGSHFGVELVQQEPPEGSLREYCNFRGIPIVTYEAVEHRPLDNNQVQIGVDGILKILQSLNLN